MRASEITLVEAATGKPFPCAPSGAVFLSSVSRGWRGIVVELHHLEPLEMPEHYVPGHGLCISASRVPVDFGWQNGDRQRECVLNPEEFHFLPHGESNTPRWLQTFEELSLVLDPQYVANVVKSGLPTDNVEFAAQHAAYDAIIARYAEAFRSELTSDQPNGLIYVDTLCIGYVLHLLSSYSVFKSRPILPRGKLTQPQLTRVVDFILSNLTEDLSLLAIAEEAHASPFHFARQFQRTVGLPPHQFVLQQRIQKSLNLIRSGKLPLGDIALESGFFDQAHFTHAFRKAIGVTPAQYWASLHGIQN